MSTLFRTRRRAEEFSARVDGTGQRNLAVADPDTDRLVGLVSALRAHGTAASAPVPRPEFAADLRERLLAEAGTVVAPAPGLTLPSRPRGKRERRLAVAASVAVLLGGTAGVAAAAQQALPGEALYPLKRGIENVEVRLATSPSGRGQDLLDQATGRLDEARRLLDDGSVTSGAQVPGTLDAFVEQAGSGADLMLGSYRDDGDSDAVAEVRRFAADDLPVLAGLAQDAPPEARSSIARAAQALTGIDRRASATCPTCADLPALRLPVVLRAAAEADRALANVSGTHLDNSHPVAVDKTDPGTGRTGRTGGPGTGPVTGPAAGPVTGGPATGPVTDGATGGAGSASGAVPAPSGGGGTAADPAATPAPEAIQPLPALPRPTGTPIVKVKVALPTQRPSVPGGLPSQLPTRLPTKVPTKVPSGLPTGLPSGLGGLGGTGVPDVGTSPHLP
jgi:hypothetical protein